MNNNSMERLERYGDGIFETIFWIGEQHPLMPYHYERLKTGFEKLQLNPTFLPTYDHFVSLIKNSVNSDYPHRVRITAVRVAQGNYFVENELVKFVINSVSYKSEFNSIFVQNLGVCPYYLTNGKSYLNGLKTCNCLPYIVAGNYAQKNLFDDCLMTNTDGRISEATSSNVFIVVDNQVYTPPVEEGLVLGTFRQYLIDNSELFKFDIKFKEITTDFINKADEIFLTNAVQGIKIVRTFNGRKLQSDFTKKLRNKISSHFKHIV
ncbi:MAG: aminotransferase class IV [Saprospiraceae bacterium]|nr:aminotransferase class IV [Saprospiraceae bacterium]